ncbi:MAG: ABC transporter permease [Gammaproteobacteria bacterium]
MLIARSSRRFLLRHPGQLGLALAGIAAGVAVVVGVELAGVSAERAFTHSVALVAGNATHEIVGTGGRIPEALYTRLSIDLGIDRAAPVVEGQVRIAELPDAPVTLLGLDPFAEAPFRDLMAPGTDDRASMIRLLVEPRTVLLPRPLAERLSAAFGDKLHLRIGGETVAVTVVGIVTPDPARARLAGDLVLADITTVQELLGLAGQLSRIDLILGAREAETLADVNLGSASLVSSPARSRALVEMTRAFRTNLTALSLLALLVGAFLIYSTMSFLVVQRRRLFGLLRAIGVSRGELFRLVLSETAVIALAGTLAGLALGTLLGSGLVALVTRTIEDLYFEVGYAPLWLDAGVLATGCALGLGISLLAAFAPAREAAASPPRAVWSRVASEASARARLPRLLLLSAAFGLSALAAFQFSGRSLTGAFFGLFCVIAAVALATPAATMLLMAGIVRLFGRRIGLTGRFAARSVVSGLSRTGVATAALAVAVATVIGIGVMIESFRASVSEWLETTLRADFYISAEEGSRKALDDSLAARVASLPGVRSVSRTRRTRVPTDGGELRVWGIDAGTTGWQPRIIAGDAASAWARFEAGDGVLVSEPFARRHGTAVGDRLTLPGIDGARAWPVAGVFVDYTTDQGVVALALDTYRAHFSDRALSGIAVYLAPNAAAAEVRSALANVQSQMPGLRLASNREIRAASLEIFERTFTVTGVLRLLAGCIALLGIYSALQALSLERRPEVAVLRAVGFTPAEVRRHVLAQTALLGLSAAAVALPLGIALAWILVRVINERAFGWSMAFELSPAPIWQGAALALAAALLAGLRPAFVLAQGPPAEHLRTE